MCSWTYDSFADCVFPACVKACSKRSMWQSGARSLNDTMIKAEPKTKEAWVGACHGPVSFCSAVTIAPFTIALCFTYWTSGTAWRLSKTLSSTTKEETMTQTIVTLGSIQGSKYFQAFWLTETKSQVIPIAYQSKAYK